MNEVNVMLDKIDSIDELLTRCFDTVVAQFASKHGIEEQEVKRFLEEETFATEYGLEIDVLCEAIEFDGSKNWEDALLWGAYGWDVL